MGFMRIPFLVCLLVSHAYSAPSELESRLQFTKAQPAKELSMVRMLGQVVVPAHAQWTGGPAVEARLTKWQVSVGTEVKTGDVLAELISPELQDLTSQITELESVVIAQRKNVRRLEASVEAGFKSATELNEARLALSTARAHLKRVKTQRIARSGDLRSGQWISPVNGSVTAIMCSLGGLYSAESKCITIVATDAARLRVDVSEHWIQRLDQQAPTARWHPNGGQPMTLALEHRGASLDPHTRTQAFYFKGSGLIAGTSGPVDLAMAPPEGAVVIPRMAVLEVQGQMTVFVKNGEARPKPTRVNVVGRQGTDRLVTGIPAGSQVVSHGAFELKSILAFE